MDTQTFLNVCNFQENGVRARCAAVVNHYAKVDLLLRAQIYWVIFSPDVCSYFCLVCGGWVGRPHSADKKFVRARGPQNWNPEVFEQTRCSRILHVEFPQKNRELLKAEVFEKRVFEQMTPFKLSK